MMHVTYPKLAQNNPTTAPNIPAVAPNRNTVFIWPAAIVLVGLTASFVWAAFLMWFALWFLY